MVACVTPTAPGDSTLLLVLAQRLIEGDDDVGGLQLLVREGHTWCGVGEPRRDGAAAGP